MSVLTDYKYGEAGSTTEQTAIAKAIADTMVSESELLRVLDFAELTDNNISRQRMYKESDVQEHTVGDTWNIVNPTWEYRDAPLTILGDNVTIDNFGALAGGDSEAALMASNIAEKARGMSRRFDKLAIYAGTTSTGSLSASNMVGLLKHIARVESSATVDLDGWLYTTNDSGAHNTQVVFAKSGDALAMTIGMLEALRDAVQPKATHIMVSRLMRRKVGDLYRAQGNNLEVSTGKLGEIITRFGEQQLIVNDEILDNLSISSGYVTAIASYDTTQAIAADKDVSPVFAFAIGKKNLCGLNGKGMIQVENLGGGGPLENLDAKGKRIKAYLGLALRQHKAAAVLLNASHTPA